MKDKQSGCRRLLYPNSYYHIFNRGNHKKRIFHSTHDYEKFIQLLQKYCFIYEEVIPLAYCLMPNHYHILIKTGSDPSELSKLMQRFMTAYVLFFNKKYVQVGRLFQSRYNSKHLPFPRDISRIYNYIKNNPIEANLCRNPEDYKWLWLSELLYYNFERKLVENKINSSKY
jgi:putative transposase